MDNSSNVKALTAAFALLVSSIEEEHAVKVLTRILSGIVVNAASVALFLYIKGHGSSLIRDGPRLALVTFLTTSALWAQTDFIATLIHTNSTLGCQTAIAFASAFDQLARISLFQGLLWGVNSGAKAASIETLVTQALIFLRFVLGCVFVGVQRPQLDTVCVTRTLVLPVGIAIVVTDGLFVAGISGKAVLVGLFRDAQGDKPSADRSKAIMLSICGLAIWTAVGSLLSKWAKIGYANKSLKSSAPMMLGIKSIDLIARTAVPAGSLAILIG